MGPFTIPGYCEGSFIDFRVLWSWGLRASLCRAHTIHDCLYIYWHRQHVVFAFSVMALDMVASSYAFLGWRSTETELSYIVKDWGVGREPGTGYPGLSTV